MTSLTLMRGSLEKLPEKFKPYELFYVTDCNILGVADGEGKPQLLVNVEDFDITSTEQKGEQGKLYREVSSKILYTYDGSDFKKVNFHHHRFSTVSLK